ncbi:MAG: DUF4914 family protein [Puniceicoccaceae bacterium]
MSGFKLPYPLPPEAEAILAASPRVTLARSIDDLIALSVRDADENGWQDVGYDVPGHGYVTEARVCAVSNGIAANYIEPYMRRRDPDCMVIGDKNPTDKPTYETRFGSEFGPMREKTFEWLKTQNLAVFPFFAGIVGKGVDAFVIAPDNAGFFALGLGLLQGLLTPEEIPANFAPKAIIYVAPPFRHTDFEGKQVVVHVRGDKCHELFSYNLYPGPSAKKGVYGFLLNVGEGENWVTMHGSTVSVITPYGQKTVIAHEGASGGGKSEMLEQAHREEDGSLLLGRNTQTGERRTLTLPSSCDLRPVTDDMALCHPSLNKGRGKVSLIDAEDAWFVRVNHIRHYGTDPHLEKLTIHPDEKILFLNIKAAPGSTALIWEHIEDAPGQPCPNPRVVIPRNIIPGIVKKPVDVDVRSLGVRCPPCTREHPTYGIMGFFQLLPPSLGWLWRLVAPRGHANPSIVESEGMSSEGVGSYWPFATGRKVDQANLLLQQIIDTPSVKYILVPNQHVGAWEVSFMPQWVTREYIARRGGATFRPSSMRAARCPLLGYVPTSILIEGRTIGSWFFEVENQPEVGEAAYDAGAEILYDFFRQELRGFLHDELHPTGRAIIDCCLDNGTLEDYLKLIPHPVLEEEE